MTQHAEFHYSVTVKTHDLAVLNCLRGLSQFAQRTGNKRIPWGGTKESDWMAQDHCATFHFTCHSCRREFLAQVERLLPRNLWAKVRENDTDPAKPQERSW
jgi:hypothetical protein